ncbi:hypothetical protein M1P56_27610 [Streptomyces sp. HU2014]|uniref:hypothetical protein n=1 Tax=Streptomyces sp. HU2014 TaxID=2939414 RepID=UPI002010BEC5|nr:hypothetical protein [Streptomyces sp. HU2014]UQI47834.1 hypothetical protein M1P56_27610 [Streptomyces sp. HU2014]
MTDRSLAALGLGGAPAELPLTYPGRPVTEPALLTGDQLLPLCAAEGRRLGDWRVVADEAGPPDSGPRLDAALAALGRPTAGRRHPVIAVGSNASPAQLLHKLTGHGLSTAVPMVPVRVRGVGVGCSGHIGRHGYVAAAPYADPAADRVLVISWLDTEQLAAVDATEFNYRRALLPGTGFPMAMPSGERLGGAYLYVSVHGVLVDEATGLPLPGGGDQHALLSGLLAASAELRALLGPDPASWVARARADEAVRTEGRRILRGRGPLLTASGLPAPEETGAAPRRYDELPPAPPLRPRSAPSHLPRA